ncbi:MAG TPA: mycofactocin radical SAM maturase [Acidimicrobiales bacterium]|nr:mycofactocin radical SAM maturase [Acidimicrobiales bacterium]
MRQPGAVPRFDAGRRWARHPRVALRPEPFGALAYHYDNRRLAFLTSPVLVEVVRSLGEHPTAAAAVAAVGPANEAQLLGALSRLAEMDLIVAVEPEGPEPASSPGAPAPAPGGTGSGSNGDRLGLGSPRRGSKERPTRLRTRLAGGLGAPICLTWELTYACNLACVHCLSSSGTRDPRELTAGEARSVVDDLAAMGVFYVNVGGGEPLLRPDFFDLVGYAVERGVGVKFSTNGSRLTAARAARLTAMDYVDVQVSLDGATAEVNDRVRGVGSYRAARRAMDNLASAGFGPFKISVVVTRHNVGQLDELEALARVYGAQLRLTRLRPSGRGADSWHRLRPTAEQQRDLYRWLRERPEVLTGDSFFHLSAFGEALPGLNMCGAGRVVCLIDPVGDVYACPFVIHDEFRAGNVRDAGGFAALWRNSARFGALREPASAGACSSCGAYDACGGGCMAAKFYTGIPLDGPDPECVLGHGAPALAAVPERQRPHPGSGHSKAARRGPGVRPVPVHFARLPVAEGGVRA